MLRLETVSLRLGAFTLQADFDLPEGTRATIIGASGSGKSTLLDIIAGFRRPDRGHLFWQGRKITGLAPHERPVAILFQDTNLFPHLDVMRNLLLALRPASGRAGAGDRERVSEVLARVGLAGFEHRRLAEMSGGQQSRAALARVLLQDRPVLLLDEPFAALGPALKSEMLDLVGEVASALGLTVMLVTHDPGDARRFAPQTLLVEGGLVHAPQPTGPLLDNPPAGLRDYLGS